jgi:proline dehydrogenase
MTEKVDAVNFDNTKVAFEAVSDHELKEKARLFKLMNKPVLVNAGTSLALLGLKLHLPFVKAIIKRTIFKLFCGGTNLMDCQATIDHLYSNNVLTMLDYGAEGKNSETDFDQVAEENLKAIDFAASTVGVPLISTKVSGLAKNAILEKKQNGESLTEEEQISYRAFKERMHEICDRARSRNIGISIDAEETWIQDTIDEVANELMREYNQETIIVYNTYQMYRKDMLANLKRDYQRSQQGNYILGAKLVRGAYLEKERERAKEEGRESPVHESKEDTDQMYNDGIRFCLDHYQDIAFVNASHNEESNLIMADIIEERGLDKKHVHLNFCQLYGMSDHITFNLAKRGYNVAKYVPYGPVRNVIPYLVRRAEENTAVTGEMGREYAKISKELRRRGID